MAESFVVYLDASDAQLRGLQEEMVREWHKVFLQAVKDNQEKIRERARLIFKSEFEQEPVVRDLIAGFLRLDIGVDNPEPALDAIVTAVAAAIEIDVLPPKGDSVGGVRIELLNEAVLRKVVSAPGTSYISYGKRGTHLIPWLAWLLFYGNSVILANSEVKYYRNTIANSRTGHALMFSPKNRPSAGFSLGKYAGTVGDNFVTRAMDRTAKKLFNDMPGLLNLRI